jgi:hypothetical protein
MNFEVATSFDTHPISVIRAIVDRYGPDLVLTFSRYQIGPPGDQEKRRRTTFEVLAGRSTRLWLQKQLRNLGPDEELALHSRVSIETAVYQMFMIDYEQSCSFSQVHNLGLKVFAETRFAGPLDPQSPARLYSFETGRCYHQYADLLIPEAAWHLYLGSLLLLTPPREASMIDIRWIGHALRRGYAALRWSHNTGRYLLMPRLIEETAVQIANVALDKTHFGRANRG